VQIPVIEEFILLPTLEQKYGLLRHNVVPTLVALHGKNPTHIVSYAILDLEGNILLDTDSTNIVNYEGDYLYFNQVMKTDSPQMSPVEFSMGSENGFLYFGAPIRNQLQETQGILRVKYDANVLQAMLASSADLVGKDSFGVLFDENLLHLAHGSAPETIFTTVVPLSPEELLRLKDGRRLPDLPAEEIFLNLPALADNLNSAINSDKSVVYFEAEDIATGDRLNQVVVIDLETPPWLLAFFQPQDIFLKPVENLVNLTILFGFVSVIGAIAIAVGFTQILTTPINRLADSANEITQGNLDTRIEVTSEDEIGVLSNTFNIMASRLQNLIVNLEEQVAERTLDIQNRATQLQVAGEIARDATSESEMVDLLDRAASLISERFDFYHVGIYLADARKEYAILAAGNDVIGTQLVESQHRYRIASDSNVGKTCMTGEPMLAPNEDGSTQISYHPLLPNTAAQMILPLKVGDAIIGAVDSHSTNPEAFTQSAVPIFLTMIDQLAIAIQKTEFREEIQKTLYELETAYGQFTRESWRKFIHGKETVKGYSYSQNNVEPTTSTPPEVIEAWKIGEPVCQEGLQEENEDSSIMAIPMKIRGEVIGVLNLRIASNHVPVEINQFVQDLADRLSLVLENARLIEVAQRQGERQRLTGEISDKIRQTLDMDSILRAAVQEIGDTLDLAEVEVRIGDIHKATVLESNGNPDGLDHEVDIGEA
jgi:nitrate/nitrite-specific signal transduction histidine kinase